MSHIDYHGPSLTLNKSSDNISQRQALSNLKAVLEAAGSDLRNVLKVNVFITTMDDFATMNEAYDEFFNQDPKPVRLGLFSPLYATEHC